MQRILNCLIVVVVLAAGKAQDDHLGTVHFPTSSPRPEAQTFFLQGIAALHSFFYDQAEEYFQKAETIDPQFAMAYWGEAMTHNHPLWSQQDIARARQVLAKLGKNRKARMERAPTPREKGFLEAVEILYGDGDKLARDIAYSEAMERLRDRFPDDDEIASFYALSLLGTVRPGDSGFRRQMKAAAIMEGVFKRNPNHPGAAHYLIHCYDDPEHAPLGLPAAQAYARIAPSANHAKHMPSHIFVQLGMWQEVAASNEAAYRTSDEWVRRKGLSVAKRDYHSLSWLQYAYLQLGRYADAKKLIDVMSGAAAEAGESGMAQTAAAMRARYAVETGRWDDAAEAGGSGPTPGYGSGMEALSGAGLAAALRKDYDAAGKTAAELRKEKEKAESGGRSYAGKIPAMVEKEILALVALGNRQTGAALRLMDEAVAIEATMDPPSGPAEPIKPASELYGEILLELNRHPEAVERFKAMLLRMPNRAASLAGLARAYAGAGETGRARRTYEQLLAIWSQADADLPGLKEAREFLGRTEQ